jgi:hypothetical protein
MDRQLKNHQITLLEINRMLGNHNKSTAEYLSKCIYVVAIGSNDYLNNYFLPQYYPTSTIYTLQQYAVVLNDQLSQQLTVSTFSHIYKQLLIFFTFTNNFLFFTYKKFKTHFTHINRSLICLINLFSSPFYSTPICLG